MSTNPIINNSSAINNLHPSLIDLILQKSFPISSPPIIINKSFSSSLSSSKQLILPHQQQHLATTRF